jgi:Protein of unknown function (DUF998)
MCNNKLINSSFWCSLIFIVILTALHFIKPEIQPSWNFISEYEIGRFGWLMQIAFFYLALSCIFLVLALWKQLNIVGKIGLIMLMIASAGMMLSAIFRPDALNTPANLVTTSGRLHQTGAMLDQIPFAAILITIAFFRNKDWQVNSYLLILSLMLVWFGFICFVGSIQEQFPADGKFGPNVTVGWQHRLLMVTQAVWLAIIGQQFRLRTQRTVNNKIPGTGADSVSYFVNES